MTRPSDDLTGILYKVSAIGCFVLMGTTIKALGPDFPTGQVVFFRGLFAFIPIAFVIHAAGGLNALRTCRPWAHFARSVVGTMGMVLGFMALALIPLVDAVAINFTATLFTTVLAALVLKEGVGVYRWSAVVVGFVGVLIMLQPSGLRLLDPGGLAAGEDQYAIGALIGLAGAFCMGFAMIAIRRLSGTETSVSIVFYFTLTNVLVATVTLPFAWHPPTGLEWAMLIGIGVLGGCGQYLLTRSYRYAQASLLAPFDYTSMLYALVLGYVLFAEVPDPMVLAGAAVVIGAGLFILWRERVRRTPRPPTSSMPG